MISSAAENNATHSDTTLHHGGDVLNAIKHFGGNVDQWLDLSTGISPWTYPIPVFDESTWRNLPTSHHTMLMAAANYYGCNQSEIIATPGSQLSIRLIPQCINDKQTVAIPLIGYQEHAMSWALAGHSIVRYRDFDELSHLIDQSTVNSAVVINPNNPTAERIESKSLQQLAINLNGVLIIDEAFADLGHTSGAWCYSTDFGDNLIILKSMGKFFGLAGARIGFTIGTHTAIDKVNQLLSPWSIAAPSIQLATSALSDTQWQQFQTKRIESSARQQRVILDSLKQHLPHLHSVDRGLFFTLFSTDKAIKELHRYLAEHKIWSRLGDAFNEGDGPKRNWLRLSLAGDKLDYLSQALASITATSYTTSIDSKQHL